MLELVERLLEATLAFVKLMALLIEMLGLV
jgi:hypothetical protein